MLCFACAYRNGVMRSRVIDGCGAMRAGMACGHGAMSTGRSGQWSTMFAGDRIGFARIGSIGGTMVAALSRAGRRGFRMGRPHGIDDRKRSRREMGILLKIVTVRVAVRICVGVVRMTVGISVRDETRTARG